MTNNITVSPEVSDEGEIIGYNVQERGQGMMHGYTPNWEHDYVEDSEGRTHHIFEDAEITEENNDFDFDDYLGDLMVVEPELNNMITWLANAEDVPEGLADAWDASIDAEDLDSLYQLLEIIQASYPGSGEVLEAYQDEVEEVEEDEEELQPYSPEAIQEFEDSLESISLNYDHIDELMDISDNFENGSIHAELLNAGMDIANGHVEPLAIYQDLVATYGTNAVIDAYTYLFNNYSHD